MLDGFWTFGGEPIVNHAQTEAYLRNGYAPAGVQVSTEDPSCSTMLDVLNGGKRYASPIVDGAPWVESADPDTYDFAGVIVTDITGTNGSTRSAEVTQYVGNGGGVSRARYGTRTIAVTALLVGRTGASVEAGLAWLSSALATDCGDTGTELCGFAACPEQYVDTPLLEAAPITETLDRRVDGWVPSRGRFRSRDGLFDPAAAVTGEPGRYGTALYGFSTYANGGPVYNIATYGESVYGAEDPAPEPSLLAPEQQCYAGPVSWAWNLSTVRGAVTVSYGAKTPDGEILSRSEPAVIQGDAALRFTPQTSWESWVPVLWVEGNAVRVAPTITHQPYLTAEQCADSYLRSYLDVATIEGPTVVDKIQFGCGEWALKVEWSWVVGNPFVFGSISSLVDDFSTATGTAAATEWGVSPVAVAQVLTASESCGTDVTTPLSLVGDPCNPGFIPPPAAPKIRDLGWSPPDSWRRFAFPIPARLAPTNNDGLLSLEFTNDHRPKRGVRVRLYLDPLGRGLDGIDECAFCTEFNLAYLPPDSTVTIDAARRRIETKLPGLEPIDSAATVRGANGGPFDFPTLQCNTGYLVVLDVPDDYGQACSPYAVGDPQGELTFAMSLRPATI